MYESGLYLFCFKTERQANRPENTTNLLSLMCSRRFFPTALISLENKNLYI